MQGTVAVTDFGWYEFLAAHSVPEVNFWTPSDRIRFTAPEFSPFFLKLKAPHRAIAGFGYFARWSSLPAWLAWECFGAGNGCESMRALESRIAAIRERIGYKAPVGPSNIGCILIVQPVFFSPDAWIAQPADWHDRTVRSASYDLTRGEGARVWQECLARVAHASPPARQVVAEVPGERYGAPTLVTPRLGQGTFRVSVTEAYARSCAVTTEHSLPALEAAHIRAYADDGPHEVRNGVLLRADLHRLYDKGYLTITPDHRLEVSARLREDYSNGRTYYPLHGQAVRLPAAVGDHPSREHLTWHNEHVYLG
ncbi:MAG: HNH endonuclease [Pseudomonadota bacterium]|jgi:putative restriction endonuclease